MRASLCPSVAWPYHLWWWTSLALYNVTFYDAGEAAMPLEHGFWWCSHLLGSSPQSTANHLFACPVFFFLQSISGTELCEQQKVAFPPCCCTLAPGSRSGTHKFQRGDPVNAEMSSKFWTAPWQIPSSVFRTHFLPCFILILIRYLSPADAAIKIKNGAFAVKVYWRGWGGIRGEDGCYFHTSLCFWVDFLLW